MIIFHGDPTTPPSQNLCVCVTPPTSRINIYDSYGSLTHFASLGLVELLFLSLFSVLIKGRSIFFMSNCTWRKLSHYTVNISCKLKPVHLFLQGACWIELTTAMHKCILVFEIHCTKLTTEQHYSCTLRLEIPPTPMHIAQPGCTALHMSIQKQI